MTALRSELTEATRIAKHIGSALAQDTMALVALTPWVLLIVLGASEIADHIIVARMAGAGL